MNLKTKKQIASEKRITEAKKRSYQKQIASWGKSFRKRFPEGSPPENLKFFDGWTTPLDYPAWSGQNAESHRSKVVEALLRRGIPATGCRANIQFWALSGPELKSLILSVEGTCRQNSDFGQKVFIVLGRKL